MTLSSMVLSRDWQEVSVLECILGGLHMEVSVESEPQRALQRLTTSKIDALIVDCDLNGTGQFFRELQRETSRASTVPLVIMGSPQGKPDLKSSGAMFSFEKPISVEQAVRTLSAARNMILEGRLRYHRVALSTPVALVGRKQRQLAGHVTNLSLGGVQISLDEQYPEHDLLSAAFDLPGTRSGVESAIEVAWSDSQGNVGLRFVNMAQSTQEALRVWLAQQYFSN